ncbi:MAG: hypothetical protein NXI20_22345 [bacterium]|nr:hypothetical protein [bacterium]
MKYISALLLLVILGCAPQEPQKSTMDFPIMGELPMGEYPVGFKTIFTFDESKNAIPFSDWEGHLYHEYTSGTGRQYQINLWYPAKKGTGKSLKYQDYIFLMGRQTNFNDSEEQQAFAQQLFINQTQNLRKILEPDSNVTLNSDQLNTLLNLDIYARENAEVEEGKYPVIIYPNGSSPAYQSITCEFLASHGYITVSLAPKGRFSSGLEISTIGLEVAVDDIEFVLSKISENPNADLNRVTIMANAISSSVGAAAVARNDKIKALISLEGGLPSSFEQRLLNKSVFYQPENISVPILFIYSPHPAIDPEFTFHLKYADKYYARFPKMSEFAMLNYGVLGEFVPDIIGKHDGDARKGFEAANELVLRFLNQKVKGESGELFDDSFINSRDHIDSTFQLTAVLSPPNIAVLKDLFWEEGIEAVDSIYNEIKEAGNPQPFNKEFYVEYRDWLAWKKDETYANRLKLYELAYDSYPESAKINYYVAYFSMRQELNDQAIKFYRQALSKLDTDKSLTDEERTLIRTYSKEDLDGLME